MSANGFKNNTTTVTKWPVPEKEKLFFNVYHRKICKWWWDFLCRRLLSSGTACHHSPVQSSLQETFLLLHSGESLQEMPTSVPIAGLHTNGLCLPVHRASSSSPMCPWYHLEALAGVVTVIKDFFVGICVKAGILFLWICL